MGRGFYLPIEGEIVAGRYRIVRPINRGGFGAIFLAEQVGLNRKVAFKTILPQVAMQESQLERFVREAQLVKDLIHPNTIRIYDFGWTEGNLMYIAMEHIDGRSLGQTLKSDGPFSEARVYRVIKQVLKSLIEAHDHGIVHRDIKPANIMLVDIKGEKADFVKLLDFGIGKPIGDSSEDLTNLSSSGQALGTPRFMAPELLRSEGVGPWSDLYALGLLMIELVTGQPAVDGTNPMDIAATQLLPMAVPLPPSVKESVFADVIRKACAKIVSERHQSAEQLLSDLRRAAMDSVLTTDALTPPSIRITDEVVVTTPISVELNPTTPFPGEVVVRAPQAAALASFPDPGGVAGVEDRIVGGDGVSRTQLDVDMTVESPSSNTISMLLFHGRRKYTSGIVAVAILVCAVLAIVVAGKLIMDDLEASSSEVEQTVAEETRQPTEEAHTSDEEAPVADEPEPVPPRRPLTASLAILSWAVVYAGSNVVVLQQTFVPQTGQSTVTVRSSPTGAYVYRGRERIGTTPYTESCPDDEPFELTLKRKGYRTEKVTVRPGEQSEYDIPLEKRKTGKDETDPKPGEIDDW